MLLMATRAFFQSRAFFQRLYDFPPRLKLAAAPLPRSPGRQLSILASAPMTIMLFACGHGYRAPDGKLYLLVAESDQTQLEATSLSRDEPAQAFGETRARIIVFIAPVTRGLCPTAAATTRSQTRSMRISCASPSSPRSRDGKRASREQTSAAASSPVRSPRRSPIPNAAASIPSERRHRAIGAL